MTVAATLVAAAAHAEPDLEAGAKLFNQCKACHQIGEDARNRVGPHLNELNGRVAGSVEGFRYSKPMAKAGADGLIWTDETLDAFLEDPKSYIPKTKMSYRGMKDAEDRADLIAYLDSFSPDMLLHSANDPHDLDPAILAIKGDVAYG